MAEYSSFDFQDKNAVPDSRFRFHAELNRFVAAARRETTFDYHFEGIRSVKDMIEAAGIPHTEVARIVVNGREQDFGYHMQAGDSVEIFPAGYAEAHEPTTDPRFVVDVHLGRLAAYLRMASFDTLYPEDIRDEYLAQVAADEDRILLTRDYGLLKRKIVRRGYYVHSTDPWPQLAEVLRRFDLVDQATIGQPRCTSCNGPLNSVDKTAVQDRLQPNTLKYYDEFRECERCHKVYWKGSHYEQLETFLVALRTDPAG